MNVKMSLIIARFMNRFYKYFRKSSVNKGGIGEQKEGGMKT
jgi:hypothetical protein